MGEKPMTRRGPLLWLADHIRPWQIGFLIGAAIPIVIGTGWMIREMTYHASLPQIPNTGSCGMGMLGAWMVILFLGPAGGTVGALIAAVASAICRAQVEASSAKPPL